MSLMKDRGPWLIYFYGRGSPIFRSIKTRRHGLAPPFLTRCQEMPIEQHPADTPVAVTKGMDSLKRA
jgi:hypothetical protein